MLVLSRYCDESVCIGDDIVITVVDVRSDRVRLGIKAPSNVSVHRQEVYDAITRDKENDMRSRQNSRREQIVNSVSDDRASRGRVSNGRESSRVGVQSGGNSRIKSRKTSIEGKLPERRGKALPVEIETHNIGFAGIADIIDG
jgi:carbon storage regulator